jgi:hypothetical protein
MIKRVIYFGYYVKELETQKFFKFLNYTAHISGKSKASLVIDIIWSVFRYNISILEYFLFHFYKIGAAERQTFAGTGFMYEYQLKMNPKAFRSVLEDKISFLSAYKDFVKHRFLTISELKSNPERISELKNQSNKIVLKSSVGQCGRGIEVVSGDAFSAAQIVEKLETAGNDFVEEFVQQHDDLNQLSPSGLNTVRIVTQLDRNNKVIILAARLRITINSSVDNMAAGNGAAPIDLDTGKVSGPAVFSDITKEEVTVHPVTKMNIVGFQVPFWKEVITMIEHAALVNENNRSIGWDVAVTNLGPELIEANHDWCKLLWQLPVKKGLKADLEQYLNKTK